MNSPAPIVADGWISTPVTERTTAAIVRGTTGTPASCSAWATRWASSAWTPGHAARISPGPTPRAAGSRSRAARTSRVPSLTTVESVPRPSIRPRMLRSRRAHPERFAETAERGPTAGGHAEHAADPAGATGVDGDPVLGRRIGDARIGRRRDAVDEVHRRVG